MASVSCTKEAVKDTLSVQPSAALEFEATDNADVTLTVTTTADKWEFTAPAWVVAERVEGTLVLNVEDNAGAARVGRITFTAGNAEPVRVNVYQAAPVQEETPDGPKVAVTLNNKADSDFYQLTSGTQTVSVSVSVSISVSISVALITRELFPHKTAAKAIKNTLQASFLLMGHSPFYLTYYSSPLTIRLRTLIS